MAEEPFPDFELIPDDDDEFTPDEELAALVDPDEIPLATFEEERQPLGRTWLVDFDTGKIVLNGGMPVVVRGLDAVSALCQVALRTRRFEHIIFSDDFGMERPDRLIGHVDDPEHRSQWQNDIVDTLLSAHERVTDVTNFDFTYDSDEEQMFVTCDVIVDDEDLIPVQNVPLI